MSLNEYHNRQLANEATNQRSQSSSELSVLRRRVQEVRAHVEKAMALIDEETNAEATAELKRAVEKLAAIR